MKPSIPSDSESEFYENSIVPIAEGKYHAAIVIVVKKEGGPVHMDYSCPGYKEPTIDDAMELILRGVLFTHDLGRQSRE